MKRLLITSAIALGLGNVLSAQAPAPPAPAPSTPAPSTQAPSTAPRPAGRSTTSSSSSALSVTVTDKSGNGIGDVNVAVTGPVDRSGRTAADGSVAFRTMRAGTYRLRFENERYITLEREIVVGARASDVSVALNPAAAPKPVVAPPAPVAPPPAQKPGRTVEPRTLSMTDFLEKNLIGSEPQKMSLFACTDGGTARVLQIKEPLTNHVNADADEVFYVVAGGGSVRVRDLDYKAGPGLFLLIPRGVPVGARREGRNPLIALTVTMGASCTDSAPLAR
jgi:mannose-6-phosphate isomerase-like protein (cupin superfamily)